MQQDIASKYQMNEDYLKNAQFMNDHDLFFISKTIICTIDLYLANYLLFIRIRGCRDASFSVRSMFAK